MSMRYCPRCRKQTVSVDEIGQTFPKSLREIQIKIRCMNCSWVFSKEGGGWILRGQVVRLMMAAMLLIAVIEYWPQIFLPPLLSFPI